MASAAEQLAANINLSSFAKADDLRKRIWFTLGALIVYRLGTYIPLPGIDPSSLAALVEQNQTGILSMFNAFAGGAVARMAIFALNIMPYITASIIMQLMSSVSPQLEALKKEGEQGRKKINQYTRYGTVLLASVQGFAIAVGLQNAEGVVMDPGWFFLTTTVITLVGGTLFLMWLGEQITERGVGNGISLLIFSGIVSGFPSALGQVFEAARQDQINIIALLFMTAIAIGSRSPSRTPTESTNTLIPNRCLVNASAIGDRRAFSLQTNRMLEGRSIMVLSFSRVIRRSA